MKYKIIFVFFIFLFFACKSDIKPLVYDKTVDVLDKEIQIIHLLLSNENYVEADKLFEKNLKLYPDNPDLLLLKAYSLLQEKKYTQSEEAYNLLLKKNKANPLAYLGLARIYKLTDKFDLANENIKIGLSYSKFNSHLWFESGMIDFESQNYKEALVKFTKASNLDVKNQDAAFFKYITMLKVGREIDEVKSLWT
ncbi:MAG TPA: tetratricopeptide repeat protein, partial [Spirochaetota bacterium]|nr:tetratricopeptide repeat protein [Spirochaetota bacterium]